MRDVTDLQPNPDKPGWYFGFVVVNTTSNVVHDIYPGLLKQSKSQSASGRISRHLEEVTALRMICTSISRR